MDAEKEYGEFKDCENDESMLSEVESLQGGPDMAEFADFVARDDEAAAAGLGNSSPRRTLYNDFTTPKRLICHFS